MPGLAGDVLGIIDSMGIVFCRRIIFTPYLQLCGLVDVGAR